MDILDQINDKGKLMSTPEVAALLNVTTDAVARYIRTGQLEAIRMGTHGQYRISPSALKAFLEVNKVCRVDATGSESMS